MNRWATSIGPPGQAYRKLIIYLFRAAVFRVKTVFRGLESRAPSRRHDFHVKERFLLPEETMPFVAGQISCIPPGICRSSKRESVRIAWAEGFAKTAHSVPPVTVQERSRTRLSRCCPKPPAGM